MVELFTVFYVYMGNVEFLLDFGQMEVQVRVEVLFEAEKVVFEVAGEDEELLVREAVGGEEDVDPQLGEVLFDFCFDF